MLKYQIWAKTSDGMDDRKLECCASRLEAEALAEEYATGKEAVYSEYAEQAGHPCIVFIPTQRVASIYVVPVEES